MTSIVVEAMEKQLQKPPEVRILRISNYGEVFFTFTNEMIFPSNFTAILNKRSVKGTSTAEMDSETTKDATQLT